VKPYYEQDGITIYYGDCRDVLPTLAASAVQVVLTDPPFFMPAVHYAGRARYPRSWSDTSILAAFWGVILDECVRTLTPTGHLFTFCNGDSYPVFYPEMYRRFDYLKSLVWDKGSIGMGRVWRNQHELVIAARWKDSVFVDGVTTRADVIRTPVTPPNERLHPVEKPVALLRWLLEPTLITGGLVLDPFMGAGPTLICARSMGASAIGIEGEERYCEIAAKRLTQGVFSI